MAKSPEMQQFCDDVVELLFGPTPEGCCVFCKQPPKLETFTEAGKREWEISHICEPCFDQEFKE